MAVSTGLSKLLTEFTTAAVEQNPSNFNEFGRKFFESRVTEGEGAADEGMVNVAYLCLPCEYRRLESESA